MNIDSKDKDLETLIKRNSETAQSTKAEVTKFYGKHLKRFNIVDSDICKFCNIGIQDRAPELLCTAG
jgi:hypothetical protein